MPEGHVFNAEGSRVRAYRQDAAAHVDATDVGLDALRAFRKEAAGLTALWAPLRKVGDAFAKAEMKRAQRLEKAATTWLQHFERIGVGHVFRFPLELAEELDLAFNALVVAEDNRQTC